MRDQRLKVLGFVLFSLLLVTTCRFEGDEADGRALSFKNLPLPELISHQAITGLKAEAILDGETLNAFTLAVNAADDSCSGTISSVKPGDHQVTIIYYVMYGATTPVELKLAEQTQTVKVISGKTITAHFPDTAYTYPDNDNDTLSNLWEYQNIWDPFTPCYECLYRIDSDLRVTADAAECAYSSLSWTGSEFWVSWTDGRDSPSEVYFARVSSSGVKIGSDLRVTADAAGSYSPSLSWTGSEFGVSWIDDRDGNYEIYFARESSSGVKIGSDLRVTADADDSQKPSLSWTGSEFGVSWEDIRDGNSEIYFARVSSSGVKIGSDLRVTADAEYSYSPSLSWTGSEFGMSWQDFRDWNNEIYFARVSSSGVKIGSDLRMTMATDDSNKPSLSWTGSEFGVSWYDLRNGQEEIFFARVSSSGAKIGSDLRVTAAEASKSWESSLFWTGSEFGLSWNDYRVGNGNYEIFFARVSSSGVKIGSDLRVTVNAANSWNPSLSWTGSEFGVSWFDERDGNREIYFARIGVTP